MENLFGGMYKGRTVLVTGHTGFKGSWLSYWLTKMGAKVVGYSLGLPTVPTHFELLGIDMDSFMGDTRDKKTLRLVFERYQPEIVFHLAAQPIVRLSYLKPIETLETNIMGTANVFETCRETQSVKAILNITSDKCYENKEWIWGYRENDEMGGYDPYSVSKGCSELITAAYRKSFFNSDVSEKSRDILLASCRAGNVIGGGDWGEDRLIPDIMRAAAQGADVIIRNPEATRPWQHVLEPLSGYLTLGWRLLEGRQEFASGWNFGPDIGNNVSVSEVVDNIKKYWDGFIISKSQASHVHEANLLMLDCSKTNRLLEWKSVWNLSDTIRRTTEWYLNYYCYYDGLIDTEHDISAYIKEAREKDLIWTR